MFLLFYCRLAAVIRINQSTFSAVSQKQSSKIVSINKQIFFTIYIIIKSNHNYITAEIISCPADSSSR